MKCSEAMFINLLVMQDFRQFVFETFGGLFNYDISVIEGGRGGRLFPQATSVSENPPLQPLPVANIPSNKDLSKEQSLFLQSVLLTFLHMVFEHWRYFINPIKAQIARSHSHQNFLICSIITNNFKRLLRSKYITNYSICANVFCIGCYPFKANTNWA